MALIKEIYGRVEDIDIVKRKGDKGEEIPDRVSFTFKHYIGRPSGDPKVPGRKNHGPIETSRVFTFYLDPNGPSVEKQCYAHLKGKADYEDYISDE